MLTLYDQNHSPNPNWYLFKTSEKLSFFVGQMSAVLNIKSMTREVQWPNVYRKCYKYILPIFCTICPISQKIWDVLERQPSWASTVREPRQPNTMVMQLIDRRGELLTAFILSMPTSLCTFLKYFLRNSQQGSYYNSRNQELWSSL